MSILVPRPYRATPCFPKGESQEAWQDLEILCSIHVLTNCFPRGCMSTQVSQWHREVLSHFLKERVWSMVCKCLSLSGLMEMHNLLPHGTDHSQKVKTFLRNSRCLRHVWACMLPLWGLGGTLFLWHKAAVDETSELPHKQGIGDFGIYNQHPRREAAQGGQA